MFRNIELKAGANQDYSDTGSGAEDDEVSKGHLFINIAGTETTLDMGIVDVGDDR